MCNLNNDAIVVKLLFLMIISFFSFVKRRVKINCPGSGKLRDYKLQKKEYEETKKSE